MKTQLRRIALLVAIALPVLGAEGPSVAPDDALARLMKGNQHFVLGKGKSSKGGPARRREISKGQHPFAVVICCSDSRVPPEMVFDQDLGDLFVVRTAGNVVADYEIASIEYALKHLGPKLVMVLGHTRCGAVDATVNEAREDGRLPELMREIEPAVEQARKMKGDLVDNSARQNVRRVMEQLENSEPVISELVKEGKVRIVGAYYDLSTGRVSPIQ